MLSAILPILLFLQGASIEPKLATIDGKVLHAATKTPIRKAKVTLAGIGFEGGGTVDSGDDGTYTFKDVKPGRYRVSAERAGYEATGYGARPGEAQGQALRVDAGASLSEIVLMLPKQGVIAGRVLDAESEPVAKVLVMALASIYVQNGRKARIPRGTLPALTNDLGEYRIGQLPPGKYILCAVPQGFYQPAPEAKESKPGAEDAVVTTCFPSVREMAEATSFEIQDSSEIQGIDLRMLKTRTVTVHGRITGVPPAAGTITILNLNTKNAGPIGNATSPRAYVMTADGKFEFKNVPPGSYIMHSLPTGLGNQPFIVKANVDIPDQPLTELLVPAAVPFQVKGKITAEPSPELKLTAIRVVLTPADEITSALAMGTANADGELTLANVIGGRHRVQIAGLPPTHYVKEIRAGEQAAEGDEVEILTADTPLSLTFALGRAEIVGAVLNAKGERVVGAPVGLIPEPRRAYRLRTARTDQNGVYRLQHLPPGKYELVAFDSVEPGSFDDEEFVKPHRSKMKKVTVEAEGTQSIDLPMVAGVR